MAKKDSHEEQQSPPFPIVGIGASAGGLEALKRFFSHLKAEEDSGMAFIIIQHLDPSHDSLMVELLDRHTTLRVRLAEEGLMVAVNEVYLIPPNRTLVLRDGKLRLSELAERRGLRLTIDIFLRSLAEDQGARATAVILTGTGSDGAAGLRAIKEQGGLTVVQEPGEADYDGMPKSAIATGAVDRVLPVEQIPEFLQRFARHPYLKNGDSDDVELSDESATSDFNGILTLLNTRLKLDFLSYKPATLLRRIERRMGLSHLENLSDYLQALCGDEAELKRLAKDLMIGVTSFFRDSDAFTALDEQVLQVLVKNAKANSSLRIWIAGCASGEEAYSLAMLLLDQMHDQNKNLELQIFASDIDETALEIARNGIYPVGSVSDVSAGRLQRYFNRRDDERFEVNKTLRETVVFARQNLVTDPPFSRLDLISCRNLLIYLKPPVQKKLIATFHFALRPGGYLFLGNSESAANDTSLFEPVSKKWRLYRSLERFDRYPADILLPTGGRKNLIVSSDSTYPLRGRANSPLSEQAPRWIADAFAPATVIINRRFETLYFHGPVGRYMDFPPGEANLNLLDLLREGLTPRVRNAVLQAQQSKAPVELDNAHVKRNGQYFTVSVRVQPAPNLTANSNTGLLLVAFTDRVQMMEKMSSESATGDQEDGFVHRLEDELRNTREDLQSTIEELEASNEELKASNEEVMSVNEELQSTNEELETSKEELQSLNEELTTVNSQLQDKVGELENAHNDIINLLDSSKVATLFLDTQFRARRFNPATTELFNLIPSDIGRSLTDVTWNFTDPEFINDARKVLDNLVMQEATVQDKNGCWFHRRIQPYRTQDNRISGVVVTFADVTRLYESEQMAQSQLAEIEAVYKNAPVGLAFHDKSLRMLRINDVLAKFNGRPLSEQLNKRPGDFLPEPLAEKVEKLITQVLESGHEIAAVELHGPLTDSPEIARDWLAGYHPVKDEHGDVFGVNVMVQDITERKQAERRIALRETIATKLNSVDVTALHNTDALMLVLPAILDAFGEHFGADLCEYWEAVENPQTLTCTQFRAPQQPSRAEELKHHFDETAFRSGEGLIGQVWAERTPKWLADVRKDPTFGRISEAIDLGLATGFAFPVLNDKLPIGVISVFTRERLPFDKTLVTTLTEIGHDLGNWLGRRRAEQRLKVAVSATGAALYEHAIPLDASTYHDPRWAAILGYQPDELPSYNHFMEWLYAQVHPDDLELLQRTYNAFIAGHTPNCEAEIRLRHRRGHWVWVRGYSRAMARNESTGEVTRVAGLMFDIDEQKQMETRLREIDQRRSDFLSVLGHELRNPLAGLSTAAKVLEQDEKRRDWALRTINSGVVLMSRLLDDLLDLSRIDRNKLTLRTEPLLLNEVVEHAVITVRDRIDMSSQHLEVDLPAESPQIHADPVRFEQVLINLLTNASKFTPAEGKIRLSVSEENNRIIVSVSDTGIGLPAEALERIFEPFEQLSSSSGTNTGLGIGLALVKRLIELHHGSVNVHSDGVDCGTTFSVQIPSGKFISETDRRNKAPAKETQLKLAPELKVLVVDDVEANATGLSLILQQWGCDTLTAFDGATALSLAADQQPQVLILDLGMPDISGYDIATQLREQEKFKPLMIALSGYGDDAARQKALAAGFDHHIAKPPDLKDLHAMLAQLSIADDR